MPKLVVFFAQISTKTSQVCYKVSFCLKTFSRQHSCSAINYLSKGINILAGDDPVPAKFGPTGRHQPPIGRTRVFENKWLISAMFTDSCGRVGPYLQITCSVQHIVNLLTKLIHKRQKMTEKHMSVNNVLWRVVAGRIRRGRGPDAARGPPVGHPWLTWMSTIMDAFPGRISHMALKIVQHFCLFLGKLVY